MHECLIAFGSNLGDGQAIFKQTLDGLDNLAESTVLQSSGLVSTRPIGGPQGQPDFLNAAVRLNTNLDVQLLHEQTMDLEQALGRDKRVRWGARKLDLDLLLFDASQFKSERLTIPHPRMSFRRFVLEPAAEIAGEMMHPVCGLSVSELLNHLDQKPDEIVWLTRHEPEVAHCLKRLATMETTRNWVIHPIDDADEFDNRKANAKLVLLSASLPFDLQARRFRGPRLELPNSAEDWESEITAAIEAMQPLGKRD